MKDNSNTAVAMDLASIACAVTEIDGERIFFPAVERELEHLMQRLDFDGLQAVSEALKSLAPPADEQEQTTDIAKN